MAQNGDSQTPTTDLAAATSPSQQSSTTAASTTSTLPPTTTDDDPAVRATGAGRASAGPRWVGEGGKSGHGDRQAYEQRLVDVHLDPGAVDGKFDGKLTIRSRPSRRSSAGSARRRHRPTVRRRTRQLPVPAAARARRQGRGRPRRDRPRPAGADRLQGVPGRADHDDVDRQRQEVLRRRRRMPVRDHSPGTVRVPVARQRLARRQPRSPLQPVVLQRWHRGARLRLRARLPRVAWVRAHPDAHRRVLQRPRLQGHGRLRARHSGRADGRPARFGWIVGTEADITADDARAPAPAPPPPDTTPVTEAPTTVAPVTAAPPPPPAP